MMQRLVPMLVLVLCGSCLTRSYAQDQTQPPESAPKAAGSSQPAPDASPADQSDNAAAPIAGASDTERQPTGGDSSQATPDSSQAIPSDASPQPPAGDGQAEPADNDPPGEPASTEQPSSTATNATSIAWTETLKKPSVYQPLVVLTVGIAIVLSLIIGVKVNAFVALITAAMVVSVLAPGPMGEKIGRVAKSFGDTAGGIGVVIALAAVIGKCMLDSGAADRIVRAFVSFLGEKRASWALMGSGYVLAVPVFFDTVFYLLVPLARSLFRRTGKNYLMYILAIAAGGAITHSLVPPTPGPLLMASILNVDLGKMILVGALVAVPAALAGVICASIANWLMPVPMRSVAGQEDPDPLDDSELPSLWVSLLPVLLPVAMISVNTVMTTYADLEPVARLAAADVRDWDAAKARLTPAQDASTAAAAARLRGMLSDEAQATLADSGPLRDEQKQLLVEGLNQIIAGRAPGSVDGIYEDEAFRAVPLSTATRSQAQRDRTRMSQALKEHINRLVLEETLNLDDAEVLTQHEYQTQRRNLADISSIIGNANLALLLSTVIALLTLVRQRGLSRTQAAQVVETSLMSGGVIILITSAGGAFGAMLKAAQIGPAIQTLFQVDPGSQGGPMGYLLLGFGIAVVLKIAQGSSTVAMIVGSSMMAAIVTPEQLGCDMVYLATAIGGGSLVGSWMNDSGFWIFAKMGGLTEGEALKSWTTMLVVLGAVTFGVTLLLAHFRPQFLG